METHSIARLMPTTRGRNQLEQASGTMPRRANTKPMRASSAARRTSIGSVIVAPTPTAGPLIAPITGLVEAKIAQRELPAVVARHVAVGRRQQRGLGGARAVVEGLAAGGEIGAGAVAATGAGHDDRAHVVVGVGLVEGLDQLAAHRRRPRVQPLGAVERDREDALVETSVDDLLEGHGLRRRR